MLEKKEFENGFIINTQYGHISVFESYDTWSRLDRLNAEIKRLREDIEGQTEPHKD